MKKYYILLLVTLVAFLGIRAYQASQVHDHYDTEVHVHSDFAIYVDGSKLDLTGDMYQSSLEKGEKDADIHIHDADDKVVHRHAENITFAHFLESIGFKLTNDCFTMDTGEEYCRDETTTVALYVNQDEVVNITSYIPEEEDQILLYVGPSGKSTLQSELDSITDESCIHSGTCLERGIPVIESCGLTCDLSTAYVDHTWRDILRFIVFGHY